MRAGGASSRIAGVISLTLAAVASGCIDFLEPEELEPRGGELRVELLVMDTASARAEIEGELLRTRREDGTLAPVLDSTLRLFGRSLPPEPGGQEDVLRYRAQWTLTAAERGQPRIELQGPVTGTGQQEARIAFPLIARAGPDSLFPKAGQDLRLALDLGSTAAYGEVGSLSWTLVVSEEGSDTSLLIMRGRGRPPDTLGVARKLLETGSPGAVLEALFFTRMHARRSGEGLPYEMQFDATTAVDWTVVLE